MREACAALTGVAARAQLTPEVLDFAPDLLSIHERPPARLPRAIVLTVVALTALLLLWASLARLDIIATAEGRLVPLTFTKVVQPAESGVISEILVKEGEFVREGQLLVRLDARLSHADSSALEHEVALKKLTLRRIDAELADQRFLPQPSDSPGLYSQVEAQFRARRQAYLDSLAQENEALNRARADLRASQQLLSKLTQTLPTYRKSADAYAQLQREGFFGELAASEKRREAIEKEQDLKAQEATVQSLRSAIGQSERRIASLRSQYRSQLENERIETVALLNRSGQELEKTTVRASMLEVRAPNAGIVKDLATTTEGAVVAAGALLMNIVPKDEPLQAEVLLKNEDVGFVAVGQKAMVKVAAYPFQKYGMLEGEVALVSADATDPKQVSPGEPNQLAYRAIVLLKTSKLESAATQEKLSLSSGMLISAEIHQGQRSVMEYLLSPVRKIGHEAARER